MANLVSELETGVEGAVKWVSGMVTDGETFLKKVLPASVQTDFTQMLGNVYTEFVSAEGTFMQSEYNSFKSIVASAISGAVSKGGGISAIVSNAFAAALPALSTAGLSIAESALMQFITASLPLAL